MYRRIKNWNKRKSETTSLLAKLSHSWSTSKLSNELHYLSQYFKTSDICITMRRTKTQLRRNDVVIGTTCTLQIIWMSPINKWWVKFLRTFFFFLLPLCSNLRQRDLSKEKKATVIELSNLWPSVWRVSCDTATRSYFLPALFPIGDSIIQEGGTEKKTRNKSWPKYIRIARMLEKRIRQFIFTVLICTRISFAIELFGQRAIRFRI